MLLAINANNTNTVFAMCEGDELKRSLAHRDRRHGAPPTNMSSGSTICWRSRGCRAPTSTARSIASVVPRGRFQPEQLCRRYFGMRADGGRRQSRQSRHQGRCSTGRRRSAPTGSSTPSPRRTALQGAGRSSSISAPPRPSTVVDADGNYLRRRDRAGDQPVAGGAAHGGGQAAARRQSAAPTRVIGTDTVTAMQSGMLLGLYRADRGPVSAHQDRVRRDDARDRHRRPGAAVRRRPPRSSTMSIPT